MTRSKRKPGRARPSPREENIPAANATARGRRVLASLLAGALLAAFFAQGWDFIHTNSQTSDEAVHLAAGYSYLATGDFRLNPEHPPLIKALAAIPLRLQYRLPFNPDSALWSEAAAHSQSVAEWDIGLEFLYTSRISADQLLTAGRLPNLLLGTLLVALVGWWGYRLWGEWAALTGMALAAFDPNLIANSGLVTTDLGTTLFTFLGVYLLWEYVRRPSWRLVVATGGATGLALVSKYSSVVLIGILVIILAVEVVVGGRMPVPSAAAIDVTAKTPLASRARQAALVAGIIVCVAVLMIPAAYGFHDVTTWWTGFRDVLFHQQQGHDAFLLGMHSSTGWWYYFIIAFLIKTPLGSLFLVAASLALAGRGRPWTPREAMFLLLPVVVTLGVMTRARVDIGLRYVLPIYPFLFVAASRVATISLRRPAARFALICLPLGCTAISALQVAPHQLAYFNEAVGGPGNGYRYLSDANIDWGQDLNTLADYVSKQHVPIIYLSYFGNAPYLAFGFHFQYAPSFGSLEAPPTESVPIGFAPQLFAISVSNLDGTRFDDHEIYHWLLTRTPIAKIGYSIYVYDITRDADAHVRLANVYAEYGPRQFVIPELQQARAIDPANREAVHMLDSIAEHQGGSQPTGSNR